MDITHRTRNATILNRVHPSESDSLRQIYGELRESGLNELIANESVPLKGPASSNLALSAKNFLVDISSRFCYNLSITNVNNINSKKKQSNEEDRTKRNYL